MDRILDKELAKILETETKLINKKFKRNQSNFPIDARVVHVSGKKGNPNWAYSKEAAEKLILYTRPHTILYKENAIESFIKNKLSDVEPGLKLVSVQKKLSNFQRPDILAEDKNGNPVIIEIQIGELDRGHLYKSLEYRDVFFIKNKIKPRVILLSEFATKEYLQICRIHRIQHFVVKEIPNFKTITKNLDIPEKLRLLDQFFKQKEENFSLGSTIIINN